MKDKKVPVKELRIVLSPAAYARVVAQAELLDQTPASFSRQIVMEKVTALESANAAGMMVRHTQAMSIMMQEEMEEHRK